MISSRRGSISYQRTITPGEVAAAAGQPGLQPAQWYDLFALSA